MIKIFPVSIKRKASELPSPPSSSEYSSNDEGELEVPEQRPTVGTSQNNDNMDSTAELKGQGRAKTPPRRICDACSKRKSLSKFDGDSKDCCDCENKCSNCYNAFPNCSCPRSKQERWREKMTHLRCYAARLSGYEDMKSSVCDAIFQCHVQGKHFYEAKQCLSGEQCDILRSIFDPSKAEEMFEFRSEKRDTSRYQQYIFFVEDNKVLSKIGEQGSIIENIYNAVKECHAEITNMHAVLMRTSPPSEDQDSHTDFPDYSKLSELTPFKHTPFSAIFALEEDSSNPTKLNLFLPTHTTDSTSSSETAGKFVKVIKRGNGLFFKGNQLHSGCKYDRANTRLICLFGTNKFPISIGEVGIQYK